MKSTTLVFACVTLCASVVALQKSERHFGCPPRQNVCIYPIDDANLRCETFFDFQVALHVPRNASLPNNFRRALDIRLTLPSGDVLTPEALFGKEPELRNWTFEAGGGTSILDSFLGQADDILDGLNLDPRLRNGILQLLSQLRQIPQGFDFAATLRSGNIAALLSQASTIPGLSPEALQAVLESGFLETFLSQPGRPRESFKAYAVMYRNVMIHNKYGKGPVKVTVSARGVTTEVTYIVREPTKRRAKNVVLFVGDGMALPMMAAARLVSRGMVHGKYKDLLNMEKMPYFGLQNPSGVDSIITDSANSATSMNTGQKSSADALGVYADSGDDDFAHPKQETIAEHIKRKFGMSVGVVTTAEIQDATPAAVWAHVRRRAEKAAITAQAINGCKDCVLPVQPDVIMGGGGRYFKPDRSVDGSDMYMNYSAKGYTVTHTRAEMLAAAEDESTEKLLTVSHNGNMEVWLDRNVYTDNMDDADNSPTVDGPAPVDQPNLDEMVM
ncbi:unnamed protein product, partial [Agarophyton chilense]